MNPYLLIAALLLLPLYLTRSKDFWSLHPFARFLLITCALTSAGLVCKHVIQF